MPFRAHDPPSDRPGFVVRALAAVAFALWVDAPPIVERKAFAGEASSAAR